MSSPLSGQFAAGARLPDSAPLAQVVNAVQAIPYGRPRSRTTQGVLGEWKGTCSTKHALLAQLLGEQWPDTCPRLVHRVYRVTRAAALQRYGRDAAAAVPAGGLTDVHRYLVITLGGQDVTISRSRHRRRAHHRGRSALAEPSLAPPPRRPPPSRRLSVRAV